MPYPLRMFSKSVGSLMEIDLPEESGTTIFPFHQWRCQALVWRINLSKVGIRLGTQIGAPACRCPRSGLSSRDYNRRPPIQPLSDNRHRRQTTGTPTASDTSLRHWGKTTTPQNKWLMNTLILCGTLLTFNSFINTSCVNKGGKCCWDCRDKVFPENWFWSVKLRKCGQE